jgi:hypothetical protein
MAGFAFRSGTEYGCNIVLAFDVGFCCKVQITAVSLRLAGKSSLQIVLGLGSLELHMFLL